MVAASQGSSSPGAASALVEELAGLLHDVGLGGAVDDDLVGALRGRCQERLAELRRVLVRFDALAAGDELRDSQVAEVDGRLAERLATLEALTGRRGYRALDRAAMGVFALRPRRRPIPPPPGTASAHKGTDLDLVTARKAVAELRDWLEEVAARTDCRHALVHAARALLLDVENRVDAADRALREAADSEAKLAECRERLAALEAQISAVAARTVSRFLDKTGRLASPRPSTVGRRDRVRVRAVTRPPARPPGNSATGSSDAVIGCLDWPSDQQVLLDSEPLFVSGWALTPVGPVARVEVLLDGRLAGLAWAASVRGDVADRHAAPHALLAGFDFICPPDLLRGHDSVTLEVVAHTRGGRREVVGTRQVAIAASSRPADRIAAPSEAVSTARANRASASPKPLNLLVVTHDLGFGGGQLWLSELLERAGAGRDFACTVMSPRPGPLADVLVKAGIQVHINGPFPVDDAAMFDGRVEECAGWADGHNFTAVLANTFMALPGAVIAARLGIRSVWAIHESWPPSVVWSVAYPPGYASRVVRQRAMQALADADAVVFEADATRRLYEGTIAPGADIVVRYGVRASSIQQYCADIDRSAARRRLGLDDNQRILLVMGTIEPRKSQALLAMAFREIADRHPDAKLVFVGGSDSLTTIGLQRYLDAVGLTERVAVMPVVADAYPWYRAADALICASAVESLPRSVLEAMMFGLPVLATSVFGLPEVLTDGETGLLYEPLDLNAAVCALDRLLSMAPDRLRRIAQAGQDLAFERFDSAGYAVRFLTLLQQPDEAAEPLDTQPTHVERQRSGRRDLTDRIAHRT